MTQSKEVALRGAKPRVVAAIDSNGSVSDEALGSSVLSYEAAVDHRSRS